jgi:hypothetical protein
MEPRLHSQTPSTHAPLSHARHVGARTTYMKGPNVSHYSGAYHQQDRPYSTGLYRRNCILCAPPPPTGAASLLIRAASTTTATEPHVSTLVRKGIGSV